MPEHDTIASSPLAPAIRRPSADTSLDVALLQDPGDRLAPAADICRSPAFFRLHAASFNRAWYATALDASNGAVLATSWFAETAPGEARSGAHGPYGAYYTPFSPLPLSLATRLIAATEAELRARDIRHLQITLPPAAHEEAAHAEWMNAYLRLGYRPSAPDLNYHVWVSDEPLASRMTGANRSIVKGADRLGMFARALRPNERADAYSVNVQNRTRLGRPMTMTLEALLELSTVIPGSVHWFGVFRGEEMIAASVCIRLSAEALYIFYLGEVDGVERLSPVTLLVAHIHDWCRDHGIALLDFGIASQSGVPNERKMSFKRSLGFDVSPKYTLAKGLDA